MILVGVCSHSFSTVEYNTTLWATKILLGAVTCPIVSPKSRGSELVITLRTDAIGNPHISTYFVVLDELLLLVNYLFTAVSLFMSGLDSTSSTSFVSSTPKTSYKLVTR